MRRLPHFVKNLNIRCLESKSLYSKLIPYSSVGEGGSKNHGPYLLFWYLLYKKSFVVSIIYVPLVLNMQKKGIDDDYHKENYWFLPLQGWWGHLLWWVGRQTFHCTHLLVSCGEGNVIVLNLCVPWKVNMWCPIWIISLDPFVIIVWRRPSDCSKSLHALEKVNMWCTIWVFSPICYYRVKKAMSLF